MEIAATTYRSPGVYFETVDSPPANRLPRMDIAAFVGIAEKGPVDIPVPVQDMERYAEIFGGPVTLSWNSNDGSWNFSCMANSVRSFFRNGGRRCWVVRTAENPVTSRFVLPGIVDADPGRLAMIHAASGGSWADHIRVHTVSSPEYFRAFSLSSSQGHVSFSVSGIRRRVEAGDLFELEVKSGLSLFLKAAIVESSGTSATIRAHEVRSFKRSNRRLTAGVTARARLISADEVAPLPRAVLSSFGESRSSYRVAWERELSRLPRSGELLKLQVAQSNGVAGGRILWMIVGNVRSIGNRVEVEATEGLWPVSLTVQGLQDAVENAGESVTAVLHRFDLIARNGKPPVQTLRNLAFNNTQPVSGNGDLNAHSRYWGHIPTDQSIFERRPEGDTAVREDLRLAEALKPRFPLAAPGDLPPFLIPLGMAESISGSEGAERLEIESPNPREASALFRDGLSEYSADLFIDPDLATIRTGSLSRAMFEHLYVRQKTARGLHALWAIDEVTLAAFPDAVHRPWNWRATELPELLPAPDLDTPEWLGDGITLRLTWSVSPAGDKDITSELQQADSIDFEDAAVAFRGPSRRADLLQKGCPEVRYFRVRSRKGTETGPWSRTVRVVAPRSTFAACRIYPEAPEARLIASTVPGRFYLRWTEVEGADSYLVERAIDPDFAVSEEVDPAYFSRTSPAGTVYFYQRIEAAEDRSTWFRVRPLTGDVRGPRSKTILLSGIPRETWISESSDAYVEDGLLAVHRSALRFCAARGDVMSVLSLPKHFLEEQASGYTAQLVPANASPSVVPVPALSHDEDRSLSYAAIFHPWIATNATLNTAPDSYIPPDGTICGIMADRAIRRGAWIAPANVVFSDVLALQPESDESALRESSVNPLVRSETGFTLMSARTLSMEHEFDQINVRRLFILLRRLIFREGNRLVFEPHDDNLRRRIYFQFTDFMTDLFERGAFAGRTPDEAFRVSSGRDLQTPNSIDQGRLLVEIRVAPSRPLEFILVRLVQREVEGLILEEV